MKSVETHKFKFLRGVTLKAMALLAMAVGAGPPGPSLSRMPSQSSTVTASSSGRVGGL